MDGRWVGDAGKEKNYRCYVPASISKTFQCGTSERRDATTEPPDPPPTTIKSYSFSISVGCRDWEKRRKKQICTRTF